MQPFVLNDETQTNSYGFRIPNKGIDLSRFMANPVMLADHDNSVAGVIGKWTNLRVSGPQLLADPDFDLHKPAAREIAGQVERGYLKGASMGISFDRNLIQTATDGVAELSSCQKYESSVCAIPSNANAVCLYVAGTGQPMTEAMVKLNLQGLNVHAPTGVTTVADFFSWPLAQQLNFKKQNPEGYFKLYGRDRFGMPIKESNVGAIGQNQYVDLAGITTVEQFQSLPFSQQIAFRDTHNEAYLRIFGKDKYGMPLKSNR